MKKLLFIISTILLCSCSDDIQSVQDVQLQEKQSSSNLPSELKTNEPDNKSNNEITIGKKRLIVSKVLTAPILSIVNRGKDANKNLEPVLNNSAYGIINVENNPVEALYLIVEESALCTALQDNLKNYILDLNAMRGQDYNTVDSFIIQYESSKREDTILVNAEKEAILSISSLSEAVLYSEKPRKDRDWETSTTSRFVQKSQ